MYRSVDQLHLNVLRIYPLAFIVKDKGSLMRVNYPKLYRLSHLSFLGIFCFALKGSKLFNLIIQNVNKASYHNANMLKVVMLRFSAW